MTIQKILIPMAALSIAAVLVVSMGCRKPVSQTSEEEFPWQVDRFADVRILRYRVPGFETLPAAQKELIYYLSEAALCGRDIIFDQLYRHNLIIRKTLDAIVKGYPGDRDDPRWGQFMTYVKRVWFSNGIHHHYSTDKILPEISPDYFRLLIGETPPADLPLAPGETPGTLADLLEPLVFDPGLDGKQVSQDSSRDLVVHSAVNFYQGVTQKEVEDFYARRIDPNDEQPISHGLNSRLVKKDGAVMEEVYAADGRYGPAIVRIVGWLEKAAAVAESEAQRRVIEKLIAHYRSGDLKAFDEYNILWVADTESHVDFINGFIEVYKDPLGMKGTWESVVHFVDTEATRRAETLSDNAPWFEAHSPVDPRFRREDVKGVSARVITAAMLGGDCYPSTPIGINLPNANWIRRTYGSKSVTLENITLAHNQASLATGFGEEFAFSPEILERARQYGALAGSLHTDMHECLGHGSGKLIPGVGSDALRNYHSPIEEARADLFALYFIMDPKMMELGLVPNLDVGKASYDVQVRNGLMTQLTRIEPGKAIEQAHMRARALTAHWVYENGRAENVISREIRDGKTFFIINDYEKLRDLFGRLLAEIQRITSEGDYEAARDMVETYGVRVDPDLHREVLERYRKLDLAPYSGFINPVYTPVIQNGRIVDVKIEYPTDYVGQMLRYGKDYAFL